MSNVAPEPRRWTVGAIYNGLYDYCFPVDFRETMRKDYLNKRQGSSSVQDYFAELSLLQRRLVEVTPEQHVQRAYDGASSHIRAEWAIKGILPENTNIDELRSTALDIERAHKIRKSVIDEDNRRRNNRRERSVSPRRKHNDRSRKFRESDRLKPSENRYSTRSNHRDLKRTDNWRSYKDNKTQYSPKAAKSDKQRDEYRAANKCFECGETGHIVKDCPSKNRARPSHLRTSAAKVEAKTKIHTASALLKELDKIANVKDKIEVTAVRIHAAGTKQRPSKPKENDQRTLERNATRVKDVARKVPNTIVVRAKLEGESIRILLDSGSQADLVSTTIVDQLKLQKTLLTKPLQLQLAMSGSKGMLQYRVNARLQYQDVDEKRDFDVGNLDSYDMILGTPFLFQHSVRLSFNPNTVFIGSKESKPIEGDNVIRINSISADILETKLDEVRDMLRAEAEDLCKSVEDTSLPPFRAINHAIPTIDDNLIYRFRPSRCPEALKPLFEAKARQYIKTGRWQLATGRNAIPMLFLPKKTADKTMGLRTVLDKREQNANTRKLASPLPDIGEILSMASRYKYRTLLDGKDAYEQIRVEQKDVHKTLFHTPMGTMVSLVMQQGDCNAGATYQSLMAYLFAEFIGVFMFVYLDDIIIFSNTIEEHVSHIRKVFEVLRREKFYLSPKKMQFFARILKLLGHIIDDGGIRMDPNKVDSVKNWKTPTNKDALASYLGALGFLAPNCPGIRIPMSILSKRTGSASMFRWEGTEDRAFKQTQDLVYEYRNRHRVAINYSENAKPVYLVTDASLTGASGFVSQGESWEKAPVAAFWSGKFNSAQQNYPVHDREALAIISSLKKFEPMIQGIPFTILTDHKALEHLMTQKDLSPRQARWLDTMGRFDFTIKYIEGSTNILADALSRIYSDEPRGMERSKSEFVEEEVSDDDNYITRDSFTRPLLVGAVEHADNEQARRNPTRTRKAPTRYDPEIPGREQPEKPKGQRKLRETNKQATNVSGNVADKPEVIDSPPDAEPEGEIVPVVPQIAKQTGTSEIAELITEFDALKAIQLGYGNDNTYSAIVKDINNYPGYELRDNLLYWNEHGSSRLCVPDGRIGEFDLKTTLIAQAHSILAHLGNRKTYLYMRESLVWKGMSKDVEAFCLSCVLCASSKTSTQQPFGLLKPLPTPTLPWSQIGMDFMGPLPLSKTLNGEFDMICVVVDHLTLMTHLITTKQEYTAKDIAEVLYEHVYRLHGLPEIIVSDRDKLFTSQFHTELHRLLGVELRFSTAYHPQTDGLVERMNRSVMSLVRTCVNPAQRDWAIKLPGIEFALNSSRSETTGLSPFALNYGRLPRPMLIREQTDLKGVRDAAQQIKYAQCVAHDAIINARPSQMLQANRHRREAPFKDGDMVYISTKNMSIPEGKARKLAPKFIGPYRIEETVKQGTTYRVELPAYMRRRGIRPTFHASLLKAHVPREDKRFPGRSYEQVVNLEGDEDEWLVDRIVGHRGRGAHAMFNIEWLGGEQTWEPCRAIKHLEALKQYLEAQGVSSVGKLPDETMRSPEHSEEESDGNESENLRIHVVNHYINPPDNDPPLSLNSARLFNCTEILHICSVNTTCRTTTTLDPTPRSHEANPEETRSMTDSTVCWIFISNRPSPSTTVVGSTSSSPTDEPTSDIEPEGIEAVEATIAVVPGVAVDTTTELATTKTVSTTTVKTKTALVPCMMGTVVADAIMRASRMLVSRLSVDGPAYYYVRERKAEVSLTPIQAYRRSDRPANALGRGPPRSHPRQTLQAALIQALNEHLPITNRGNDPEDNDRGPLDQTEAETTRSRIGTPADEERNTAVDTIAVRAMNHRMRTLTVDLELLDRIVAQGLNWATQLVNTLVETRGEILDTYVGAMSETEAMTTISRRFRETMQRRLLDLDPNALHEQMGTLSINPRDQLTSIESPRETSPTLPVSLTPGLQEDRPQAQSPPGPTSTPSPLPFLNATKSINSASSSRTVSTPTTRSWPTQQAGPSPMPGATGLGALTQVNSSPTRETKGENRRIRMGKGVRVEVETEDELE